MTEETQGQGRRDPLVEHVVPLIAKAMSTTRDTDELWAYLQERVESECRRMEGFSIETLARVAATMAQQTVASEAQVA
jgi:hypothetical protein